MLKYNYTNLRYKNYEKFMKKSKNKHTYKF